MKLYRSDVLEKLLKTHYSHPISGELEPKMTKKEYQEVAPEHRKHLHKGAYGSGHDMKKHGEGKGYGE